MTVPREPARVRMTCGLLTLSLLMSAMYGCTRTHYRNRADSDVYDIERERMFDWRWKVPARPVEADRRSRMADPGNPDKTPIPPDELAARQFQVTAGMPFEYLGWAKRGRAPIEDLSWQKSLPTQADGSVLISAPAAMQIAVMNSREYQFQVENVYLSALALTLERFKFMVNAFGSQSTFFRQFGQGKTDSNQLQLNTHDGFNLKMLSGAQLVVDFANTLVWEYHGRGFHTASSSLLVGLTQPLLRGAFVRIVTQQLSLAERQTLYVIRNFAQYRRQFYVNIVAGATATGYLDLLNQLQGIRNQENNIQQFARNLQEFEAIVDAGYMSPLQRDLIAFQYQQAQATLISLQALLQTSLDQYKITLGLPPDVHVELDDSPLKLFELNDPRLDTLRKRNDQLYLSLLQYIDRPPPPRGHDRNRAQAEGRLRRSGRRLQDRPGRDGEVEDANRGRQGPASAARRRA